MVEDGVGRLDGSDARPTDGAASQVQEAADRVEGAIHEAASATKDALDHLVERADERIDQIAAGTAHAARQAEDRLRSVDRRLQPLVNRRPRLALLLAAVAGYGLARLIGSSAPRVIYLQSNPRA